MTIINTYEYGESIQLDDRDKAILKTLINNARASISEISKKTGIQRDSVLYRIKRFEKVGIILGYKPIINHSKLGYPIYGFVSLELHNGTKEIEDEFINFLLKHKQVTHITKISGKWDYDISICGKDLGDFQEVLKEIRYAFPTLIRNFDPAMIIQEQKFEDFKSLI